MKYPDLYLFPQGHPPSPYDIPIGTPSTGDLYLPEGLSLYAVGWIEDKGYTKGDVPDDLLVTLLAAFPDKVVSDGTRGYHTCTYCQKYKPKVAWRKKSVVVPGYGHFLVKQGDKVYMAPALIIHYIIDHQYQPPQEFINAVLKGKFLTMDDLVVAKE
jgi:hypothetical protein